MKLKKGDTVLIIAGKDRGKTGLIEAVLPTVGRVVVAGANKYKKHIKPSPKNPQGGLVELSRAIDVSNVMYLDKDSNKPTRLGYKMDKGDKLRVAKATQTVLGK